MFFVIGASLVYAPPTGWRDEIRIVPGNDKQPYGHCCITTDPSNRIHTAMRKMQSFEPRCYDLDYYRSLDTGITWTSINHGAPGGTWAVEFRSTDIVASGDNLMMVFQKYDSVHFVKSTDGGTNWGERKWISSGRHPRIAVDGSYLHAMYANLFGAGNYEICRKYSTNGGSNWSIEQRLTNAIRNSWHPAVNVNANTIHLVWADNRIFETNYEIYYNKSTDHGVTWVYENDYQFTNVLGESEFPDIVAYTDPNYDAVHVVWQDERDDPGPGIYYRRSTDDGANWQNPIRLFANGHHPAIAADSRGLYVVWEKDSYIYYRESTDWGNTWQATLRITNTLDADSFPDITADDLGRHIVFVRRAVGSNRSKIWYKQRDIVKPAAPQNLHKDPWVVPPPVILHWDANSEADFKEYKVYRKLASGFWTQIGVTTETSYTDRIFPKLGCWYYYYVTAVDIAGNESEPSNQVVVYVPDPGDRIDLGYPAPSSYTINRDGYYQWGASPDSTADFGDCLKYHFTNLIPEYDYAFGFALFEPAFDSGRVLSIKANSYSFEENLAVPESTQYICFRIPEQLYVQGNLDLTILGVKREAVLSQILIWENIPGSGPQSMGSFGIEDGLDLKLYPVPAQDKVSISYDLPIRTLVSIEIYDCLGRVVYKNKEMQECGLQRLEWNTNHMSAGVYYIVVKHNNIAVARKILILRK